MSKYGELINVRSLSPTVRLSATSGLMWALIAWFIGYRAFGYRIWGGIVIAPLIGILIGRLSWPIHNKPRWVQIAGSLFYLYVAAACFAENGNSVIANVRKDFFPARPEFFRRKIRLVIGRALPAKHHRGE